MYMLLPEEVDMFEANLRLGSPSRVDSLSIILDLYLALDGRLPDHSRVYRMLCNTFPQHSFLAVADSLAYPKTITSRQSRRLRDSGRIRYFMELLYSGQRPYA